MSSAWNHKTRDAEGLHCARECNTQYSSDNKWFSARKSAPNYRLRAPPANSNRHHMLPLTEDSQFSASLGTETPEADKVTGLSQTWGVSGLLISEVCTVALFEQPGLVRGVWGIGTRWSLPKLFYEPKTWSLYSYKDIGKGRYRFMTNLCFMIWTCGEHVNILFSFCIKPPYFYRVYTSACKKWITLPHACNFTESAFIPVCNFLCLIWTSIIIIFCAQVVGVWKAYVSSETETVLICLCNEFQVWFPCSNTKPLLKHPVAKPILLGCWSGLSAYCSRLHHRSPELLYKPEV